MHITVRRRQQKNNPHGADLIAVAKNAIVRPIFSAGFCQLQIPALTGLHP